MREEQGHGLPHDIVVASEKEHVLNGDTVHVRDVYQNGDENTEARGEHYEGHDNAANVRRHFDTAYFLAAV